MAAAFLNTESLSLSFSYKYAHIHILKSITLLIIIISFRHRPIQKANRLARSSYSSFLYYSLSWIWKNDSVLLFAS